MKSSIQFLGGVGTVTGSQHLLKINGSEILLDCGLFEGKRDEAYQRNLHFDFNPPFLKHAVLSHAHIDHSGNIPNLVRQGFHGTIYATHATKDLAAYMLPDSGHIQEEDVKFVNNINKKKGLPPRRPLYTKEDAFVSLEYIKGMPYFEYFELTDGVRVSFCEAGHVLGAALTIFEWGANSSRRRLAYAVDLGRPNLPLLRDPMIPQDLDYLILESTYGGRFHEEISLAKEKIGTIVKQTIENGGKVIIPSFALERTQAVVYILMQLLEEGIIDKIPIFVDSPLAADITEVFRAHPECFDNATKQIIREDQDPFGIGRVRYIRATEASKSLNERTDPMIIISASGMCEGGRILHHLKNHIHKENTTILIVGFMAQHTLGRSLVERKPSVKIFGEKYRVKARIEIINSLSAHADQNELLDFVRGADRHLKGIFLVHGEPEQSAALAERLKEERYPVYVPRQGDIVALE
ncbi:MAG: MBL fold metallo-hydrolase [Candidatus Omnitrophica bacterium]|nr:MBL fold metallo-hydrolase [Candidatus Omnitrophota bacterium]